MMRVLAAIPLCLAMGGCVTTSTAPVTVVGECNLWTDPGFEVKGLRRVDQRWISQAQEIGIQQCGWTRPQAEKVVTRIVTRSLR